MKKKKYQIQLELFSFRDARSLENEILRLEAEILSALRRGDLQRAANLTREQQVLLKDQIDNPARL